MLRHPIVLTSRQTKRSPGPGLGGQQRGSIELVEAPAMHDLGFDKAREGRRTATGGLQFLRHAQRQEGDPYEFGLTAHGTRYRMSK